MSFIFNLNRPQREPEPVQLPPVHELIEHQYQPQTHQFGPWNYKEWDSCRHFRSVTPLSTGLFITTPATITKTDGFEVNVKCCSSVTGARHQYKLALELYQQGPTETVQIGTNEWLWLLCQPGQQEILSRHNLLNNQLYIAGNSCAVLLAMNLNEHSLLHWVNYG